MAIHWRKSGTAGVHLQHAGTATPRTGKTKHRSAAVRPWVAVQAHITILCGQGAKLWRGSMVTAEKHIWLLCTGKLIACGRQFTQ
jgi:hypothetical protein